jgi:6-phosphogluconolactonase (cycloisomerase 2 family)
VANGTLLEIPGSPFLTGGDGFLGGLYAATSIATVDHFLYAANLSSNTISGFSINASTGALTAVPDSPFATGGGYSLASTPDNKFLIAANAANITVYMVNLNGALTQVAGSPFRAGDGGLDQPIGIKITPNGKFLAVAYPNVHKLRIFRISETGELSPVVGSPFTTAGTASSVECNCANTLLYAGEANANSTKVDAFSLGPDGFLSPIPGSPFIGPGLSSSVVVLGPDDSKLFASNQLSVSVTVFNVAPDGSLTVVEGSPFRTTRGQTPSTMATNQEGTLLYVAGSFDVISAFHIAPNGVLTEVPGSPFGSGFGSGLSLLSVTVFPTKKCPNQILTSDPPGPIFTTQ